MTEPNKTATPPAARGEPFGKIALRLGFVTQAQLDDAVKEQATAQGGARRKLGQVLVDKGYLTLGQLDEIVRMVNAAQKRRIGDYELLAKLGEGGMGTVFKARQLSMDRVVALKVLSPAKAKNQEFRDRFVREARSAGKLNHPHIVAGIDAGTADGFAFFVMEFIEGESLLQYLKRKGGKLEEKEALEFMRQIALALQHAHSINMLHRDIKPDNILLDKSCKIAKLGDLGLARSADNTDALTAIGQALGTPYYMSPEQARGETLTPATDLYSLGGTLYHLLTGKVPFDGPNAGRIMARHITDPVPDPRELNPQVSDSAACITMKLMQKDLQERYANAGDVIADLEKVIKGVRLKQAKPLPGTGRAPRPAATPAASRGTPRPARPARPARSVPVKASNRDLFLLLGLVAVLAVALGVLYFKLQGQPPEDAQNATPSKTQEAQR